MADSTTPTAGALAAAWAQVSASFSGVDVRADDPLASRGSPFTIAGADQQQAEVVRSLARLGVDLNDPTHRHVAMAITVVIVTNAKRMGLEARDHAYGALIAQTALVHLGDAAVTRHHDG